MIVDLVGKHGRIRSVPMPGLGQVALDERSRPIYDSGFRLRNKATAGHGSLSGTVSAGAAQVHVELGLANLAPHDLRRTYALLAHQGRAKRIDQLPRPFLIETTERYLVKQNPPMHLAITWE